MIKYTRFLIPIAIFFIILSFSGCESGGLTTSGASVIKGRVTDSTSFVQLIGATITTLPATSTVTSDTLGYFAITGLSAGTYTLTAKMPGYYTRTYTFDILDEDTANIAVKMYFSNIFTYGPITVDEYFNDTSYSGVNVYLGRPVAEYDNANKDIQMRDSSGTSANFYIRSGDLAKLLAGKQTKFTDWLQNPAGGSYDFTRAQFDSLTTILGGKVLNEGDFPNDRTPYFNDPLTIHPVFGVFLKGRNLIPPTYAVIYIESVYTDSKFHAVLRIKTNRNGLNLFNANGLK